MPESSLELIVEFAVIEGLSICFKSEVHGKDNREVVENAFLLIDIVYNVMEERGIVEFSEKAEE